MQTHWRLAFMFDARGGDVESLAAVLGHEAPAIEAAARGHAVRKGVAIRAPEVDEPEGAHDVASWRHVDGAIEVTIANERAQDVAAICRAMKHVLDRVAEPGSVEVMTGAMHYMVPVRPGDTFLSLAFRRYPGTSVQQFRKWWHDQHAPIAIPVLTNELLLAYDQVHVDEAASRAAAEAAEVAYVEYDAYDNLTFASQAAFLQACSDADGMARVAEDEVGRIDNSSRRHALMREI